MNMDALSKATTGGKSPETVDRFAWLPFMRYQFKHQALTAASRMGSCIKAASGKSQQCVGSFLRRANERLVRLIPSRQTMVRFGFAGLGVLLMILSGYGIVKGAVLAGFLVMTLGYAVIVAVWLLPWNSALSSANNVQAVTPSAELLPHAISTLQPSQIDRALVPTINLGIATATNLHHVDYAHSHREPLANESSRLLKCGGCNKQFNVRGQGELAVRLIPCPHCGVALQRVDGGQPNMMTNEIAWTPIISVYCGKCHGLIDVPYATIGTSTCCPRCDADLLVPDIENRVKELRQMSNLMRA